MKKLFTHENRMIVFNLKNVLQGEGIDTHVVNEFAAGGAGDLPTFDTWPELWLEDDLHYDRARKIIDGIQSETSHDEWHCHSCGENIDAAFKLCWNCGETSCAEASS